MKTIFMQKSSSQVKDGSQKDPDRLIGKLPSYILQVRRLHEKFQHLPQNISAMDETPLLSYMVSETTVDKIGKKIVTMKSTEHEVSGVSCLRYKGIWYQVETNDCI